MYLDKKYSITRLLTKSIPANEVWAGNPAKFIHKMNDENR